MIKNLIIIILLLALSVGGVIVNNTIGLLQSTITTLQIQHKKAILKTKIKERGKRILTAVPVVGLAALAWFEKTEYDEWKQDNPDGTPEQYSQEMMAAITDVAEEYYQEINDDSTSYDAPSASEADSP